MKNFSRCPRCGSYTHQAISYAGTPSEYWLECDNCNTFINTYIPQPHQEAVHRDDHLYVGNFGAYGTGKTLTSREEVYKHIFLTPNANVLISANIAAQYEQTIKRELEADIPAAFVTNYSAQKSYMDLINGARIMYRPLYDVDNLRSLNLTMFVIVEASEVDAEAFQQLKTRTRNLAATTPLLDEQGNPRTMRAENGVEIPLIDKDWRRGIIESNPDSGWIRTDVLYCSSEIVPHGHILDDIQVPDIARDPAISSHVASTDVNAYLPPTFIDELCKNKPAWWINRFIFSSFSYAEGLVYPSAANCIIPSFEVKKEWKRIVAADYGLSDDFVYLFGAIDEQLGILHIYKEVRTNNKSIEELSKIFFDNSIDIPTGGYYTAPLLDPKSGAKRDYNKKSLYDHFLDYGISFQPGAVSVDARVFRLNTYIEAGVLRIHDCCTDLINELREYKFPAKKLGMMTKGADKPVDKNNHGINPLEWICMALPKNPKELCYGSYDRYGNDLTKELLVDDKPWIPFALREDRAEEDYSMTGVDW